MKQKWKDRRRRWEVSSVIPFLAGRMKNVFNLFDIKHLKVPTSTPDPVFIKIHTLFMGTCYTLATLTKIYEGK
jgi:hypothetical protein